MRKINDAQIKRTLRKKYYNRFTKTIFKYYFGGFSWYIKLMLCFFLFIVLSNTLGIYTDLYGLTDYSEYDKALNLDISFNFSDEFLESKGLSRSTYYKNVPSTHYFYKYLTMILSMIISVFIVLLINVSQIKKNENKEKI